MQNSDFRQKQHFYCKKKILKFDPNKPFMDELVKLSRKLKKRHIYRLQIVKLLILVLFRKLNF